MNTLCTSEILRCSWSWRSYRRYWIWSVCSNQFLSWLHSMPYWWVTAFFCLPIHCWRNKSCWNWIIIGRTGIEEAMGISVTTALVVVATAAWVTGLSVPAASLIHVAAARGGTLSVSVADVSKWRRIRVSRARGSLPLGGLAVGWISGASESDVWRPNATEGREIAVRKESDIVSGNGTSNASSEWEDITSGTGRKFHLWYRRKDKSLLVIRGRGSRKCSHYGDSVKRALSLVILVEILLVDLHDMRMLRLLTMFPLLILLPLLSIKLYLYVRMSTLSSFSIKQQSCNLFLLHHSPYLSRFVGIR